VKERAAAASPREASSYTSNLKALSRSESTSESAARMPSRVRPMNDGFCEGFRTPAVTNISTRTTAGVRKPPRDETAGKGTYWAVPRAQLWGFGGGGATAEVGSEAG
jgi:hypothetical protein